MNKQPLSKKPISNRYQGSQKNIPSMATPRVPETPNRLGFTGFILFLGISSGFIWLLLFVFGWGPYKADGEISAANITSTATDTPTFDISSPLEQDEIITPAPEESPTASPAPTFTPEIYPYVLDGEPEPVPSAMIRPQLGCEWLVIAGQVWDLEGEPVSGLTLHLFGELGGYRIDRFALSGSENAIIYGKSGYEFTLEDLLVSSESSLQVQLIDSNNAPLSLPYKIQTFEDCQRNLILVNFKQVRPQ